MEFKGRKWGWYLTLLKRSGFKVKLLYFKKGGEISRQRHANRSELWLWVFGEGKWNSRKPMKKGRYVVVPPNSWHHYKASKRTLILEIQFGKSCTEDDIERK